MPKVQISEMPSLVIDLHLVLIANVIHRTAHYVPKFQNISSNGSVSHEYLMMWNFFEDESANRKRIRRIFTGQKALQYFGVLLHYRVFCNEHLTVRRPVLFLHLIDKFHECSYTVLQIRKSGVWFEDHKKKIDMIIVNSG